MYLVHINLHFFLPYFLNNPLNPVIAIQMLLDVGVSFIESRQPTDGHQPLPKEK